MPSTSQHHRRSIRLKGYDYTQPGGYFVTIATHNHQFIFGEIRENRVILNEYGGIAQAFWDAIPTHFANVTLDAFVVMPNHVHGILMIEERDLCGNDNVIGMQNFAVAVGTQHAASLRQSVLSRLQSETLPIDAPSQLRGPAPGSLSTIVRSYKSAVTKRINEVENTPRGVLWQPRFYEHIIRDEGEFGRIREYILANPENWEKDGENPLGFGESKKLVGCVRF